MQKAFDDSSTQLRMVAWVSSIRVGEKRDSDIEVGAQRGFTDIVSDVRASIWALEGAWAAATAEVWTSKGRLLTGAEVTLEESVFRRWREVVVHTSDLGYEYSWNDWPNDYVRFELDRQLMAWRASQPMGVKDFPDDVRKLPTSNDLLGCCNARQSKVSD